MIVWDDDWQPLDGKAHEEQVRVLRGLLAPGARVVDLGAGNGRIARELTRSGHAVVAIDNDERAVDQLREIDGVDARCADMLTDEWVRDGDLDAFDAALILGHTFMTVHDVEQAVGLMRRVHRVVRPGGVLVIDVDCMETWRDIAEGNWQEGISEDGAWQLVWGEGDNVVAVRRGDEVDPESWSIRERDRVVRVWTMGGLRLAAIASGWEKPESIGSGVITMRRSG